MVLSSIKPELRHIVATLQTGNLEQARGRTVELIESVLRMSNPMYREDRKPLGSLAFNYEPGKLRALAQQLREICYLIRCGTVQDALLSAEQALAALDEAEAGHAPTSHVVT
jgi:hypothetical protein